MPGGAHQQQLRDGGAVEHVLVRVGGQVGVHQVLVRVPHADRWRPPALRGRHVGHHLPALGAHKAAAGLPLQSLKHAERVQTHLAQLHLGGKGGGRDVCRPFSNVMQAGQQL